MSDDEDVGEVSCEPYLLGGVERGSGAGDGPERFKEIVGGGLKVPDDCSDDVGYGGPEYTGAVDGRDDLSDMLLALGAGDGEREDVVLDACEELLGVEVWYGLKWDSGGLLLEICEDPCSSF
jgi:hypothetical protein